MTAPVKKGDRIRLRIESLAFGGKGVARVEGYTLFVEGGLPGQEVEAQVVRRKRGFADARLLEVVIPSPAQVEPRCRHFGVCGGCALQHLDYEAQLAVKREHVRDCLTRLGGFADVEVAPTLPSPERYDYRNKMEYTFSTEWITDPPPFPDTPLPARFGLGLHVRRRFDRVVNVERCHLQGEEGSDLVRLTRHLAMESGLPVYTTRTHQGFWRFLVVREGRHTGERMVHLITNRASPGSHEERVVDAIARALLARGPRITSLLHGIHSGKGSVAVSESRRVLFGEPVIRETLLGHDFEIGPDTFFQTNTRGAEQLFGEALRQAGLGPEDRVWDLYSGVGALSLPLAGRAAHVTGFEIVPAAVEAARRNAGRNGVSNAAFVAGDLKNTLVDADGPRPDVVVLDPPRDGAHPDVVRVLLGAGPDRVVYVSCNPATLARDLRLLADGGYAVGEVHPVDMFPHTAHIECVASLRRT